MKNILLPLLLSLTSHADIYIEPFGTSYHWDRDKKRNETNQYLGAGYRYEKYEFGVATFINSFKHRSNIVYVGYKEPICEYMSLYADIGYVTGYKRYNVLGAVGAYLEYKDIYLKTSINHKYLGVTVGYVFRIKDD